MTASRDVGPEISAVICTRNRPGSVPAAVRSVLANTHPRFEVVLVDQSSDDRTADACRPLLADRRLRYVRSTTVGLGRARNLGLSCAQSDVVAMTDDDCEAPSNWLEGITQALAEHAGAALLFCNVEPGPHDAKAGFIPAYVRSGDQVCRRLTDRISARGIGAGMAARRQAVLGLGGFDEQLGAGAAFCSGEDWDMAARAILFGYSVLETDRVSVVHHGFRSWGEGRELARRNWLGIGAAYSKLLRTGRLAAVALPIAELRLVLGVVGRSLLHGNPRGVTGVVSFMAGMTRGVRTPLDRATLLFRA